MSGSPTVLNSTPRVTSPDAAPAKFSLSLAMTSMVIVLGSVSVASKGVFVIPTNLVGSLLMMAMVCVGAPSDHPSGKLGAARVTVILPADPDASSLTLRKKVCESLPFSMVTVPVAV